MRYLAALALALVLSGSGEALAAGSTTHVIPLQPLNWGVCLGEDAQVVVGEAGPDKHWICFRDSDDKVKIEFYDKVEDREKRKKELNKFLSLL